jgi:hypothetical protein
MVTVRPNAARLIAGTVPRMPSSDVAELSSLRAQLDELTVRVVAVADRYRESPDSAVTSDLDLAERSLIGARRALERAADTVAQLD